MKIEKFEDIVAWQKSRELTKDIYELTSIGKFEKDFSLKDQIRRCSISIASNIAEGFERGGNKEFIHFLYIAKGSCAELRAQLYIASDLLYINDVEFNNAYNKAIEINKLLYGFISYLKNSNLKGDKFK